MTFDPDKRPSEHFRRALGRQLTIREAVWRDDFESLLAILAEQHDELVRLESARSTFSRALAHMDTEIHKWRGRR